jgi:hypothetical protein
MLRLSPYGVINLLIWLKKISMFICSPWNFDKKCIKLKALEPLKHLAFWTVVIIIYGIKLKFKELINLKHHFFEICPVVSDLLSNDYLDEFKKYLYAFLQVEGGVYSTFSPISSNDYSIYCFSCVYSTLQPLFAPHGIKMAWIWLCASNRTY